MEHAFYRFAGDNVEITQKEERYYLVPFNEKILLTRCEEERQRIPKEFCTEIY